MPVDSRRSGTCRSNNGRSLNTLKAVGGQVRVVRVILEVRGREPASFRLGVTARKSFQKLGTPYQRVLGERVSALVRPLPAAPAQAPLRDPAW